jgi:hypothetical protein
MVPETGVEDVGGAKGMRGDGVGTEKLEAVVAAVLLFFETISQYSATAVEMSRFSSE